MSPFGIFFRAIILLSGLHLVASQQHVLGQTPRLRNATLQDADDIATVIATAFSPLEYWDYLYQFRNEFPKEHHRCGRYYVGLLLSEPSVHMEVIEAPAGSDLSVAAVAIWTRPTVHNQNYFNIMASKSKWPRLRAHVWYSLLLEICTHRDLNFTRAIDWAPKAQAVKRKYVDEYFGTSQLHLEILATHPSYQLKGAGTRLVTAGLKVAEKDQANVTLMAAPTSETFYTHLGFESVNNVSISSVDEDRKFRFNVIAYDTSKDTA